MNKPYSDPHPTGFVGIDREVNELICQFCDRTMTEEEHNFCDICGECMEKYFEE